METAHRKYQKIWAPCNERVSLYDSLNFRKISKFCMGNVAVEQGLALQQHFPYKFPYSFKTSDCHKISSFKDGGLKFGNFDILDKLFPFLAFVKL